MPAVRVAGALVALGSLLAFALPTNTVITGTAVLTLGAAPYGLREVTPGNSTGH
ncbi:hypothetical protein [Streptomyces hokutonensis]|uniref:hypothetical protein n=1 Tax=Streptomyces hokutonensis TaxID=1306990 RepID=UPI00380500C3